MFNYLGRRKVKTSLARKGEEKDWWTGAEDSCWWQNFPNPGKERRFTIMASIANEWDCTILNVEQFDCIH